ncbi:hypothetical protein NDK25_24695 [Niallia taxi]|nr:hypothetical protein [Niallia taxi]MDE5055419.1 hypothetical protein [Niallia taxi]
MSRKKKNLTIFLHIPKKGGTTLNSIFTRQYTVKEFHNHDLFDRKVIPLSVLNEEHKKRINAVSGHHFYGVHEYFNQPFFVISPCFAIQSIVFFLYIII